MALKERINELFNERPELKNNHLALAIGCSRSTITDWRKGHVATISGDMAFKVGEFFGVSPKWVQTGIGKKDLPSNDSSYTLRGAIEAKRGIIMSPTTIQHFTGIKNIEIVIAIWNLWTIADSKDKKQRINETISLLETFRDSNNGNISHEKQPELTE